MRKVKSIFAFMAVLGAAVAARAQGTIAPNGSATLTVPGTTSLYQVFGTSGSGTNDATDALWLSFAAGANNMFRFPLVTGGVNCCSNLGELNTPDGKGYSNFGYATSTIGGINGISSANGNTQLPLVAMFGNAVSPVGNTAPAALPAWDANNPVSVTAPALWQVFYVGDGRAGFNNAAGALLNYTAPTAATRLYIGFVDAGNFNGSAGFYGDNPGSMVATVTLVPEPPAAALWAAAGVLGLAVRAVRRQARQTAG